MAGSDEPPRSFKLLMALLTIFDVGGWDGLTRGFFGAAAVVFFAFFAAGDAPAAAEAAESAVATGSLIVSFQFACGKCKIAQFSSFSMF
jgi:hypothetical protein